MADALKAAGIKRHVTFRDLRRTFGSWLANRGTGMDVIAKQLGHRSTRITALHYTQFTPEYLSAQVLANKQVFSPSRPSAG
jgi:integrase